jgi:hypothetical protein
MASELLVAESKWRHLLGLKPQRSASTHVKIMSLNAVPTVDGGLHRWLHRGDVLRLLYSEAERLNDPDLRLLADRIAETTQPKEAQIGRS